MRMVSEERGKFELGTLKFWALGDRILIKEDEFKSGYECQHCAGAGKHPCVECKGVGSHDVTLGQYGVAKKCSHCTGTGQVTCSECKGKGGLLIAPETSQRRPTTGTIVSLGPDCKHLSLNQSVLYSNFAGYVVDLSVADRTAPVVLRILHESEVLCALEGQLDMRGLKGKSEIATFQS